ncbi:hypothetical protein DFS34DRAFT_618863 [Phlyctochytrium arcticum]|nr:hypothetical protein DFS34DRAFT_618863 [Phlyctochytrium arcticum]
MSFVFCFCLCLLSFVSVFVLCLLSLSFLYRYFVVCRFVFIVCCYGFCLRFLCVLA